MFCEKLTIIRHHTECSLPMQKWSRARLRYGMHFWWLHNAKGVGPGPIQEIRDCSFSFESLRSLLRKPLFPAKWIISELFVIRRLGHWRGVHARACQAVQTPEPRRRPIGRHVKCSHMDLHLRGELSRWQARHANKRKCVAPGV